MNNQTCPCCVRTLPKSLLDENGHCNDCAVMHLTSIFDDFEPIISICTSCKHSYIKTKQIHVMCYFCWHNHKERKTCQLKSQAKN